VPALEVDDVTIGIEVGVLKHVFGLRIVLEDGPGDTKQLAIITAHEGLEGGMIGAAMASMS
jgi:hypothetical protein